MDFAILLFVMAFFAAARAYGLYILAALACCSAGGAYAARKSGRDPRRAAWSAFKFGTIASGLGLVVFITTLMSCPW